MNKEELVCLSCKKRIANTPGSAVFTCPSCESSTILRCRHCRELGAKYTCNNCGFVGPN